MQAPYNFAEPNWAPLERAVVAAGLPINACGEFMWMCEEPQGVHQYKHRATRKYANLPEGIGSDAWAAVSVLEARA